MSGDSGWAWTGRTRSSRKPAPVLVDVSSPEEMPPWPDYYHRLVSDAAQPLPPPDRLVLKWLQRTRQQPIAVNDAINGKVKLWQGDITALKAGAVVNAANGGMWAGGGICGAIHKAAGPQLEADSVGWVKKHGHVGTGETLVTPAYNLPSRFVFHTVGPQDGNAEKLQQSERRAQPSQPKLREPHLIASVSSRCRPLLLSVCVSCYSSCLDLLVEHDCRSIAFCCVSTGIFGFDNTEAAVVALDTVRSWLEREDNRSAVDALVFCCFLDKDLRIYQRNMPLFFPCDAQQPEGAEAEERMEVKRPGATAEEAAEAKTEPVQKTEEATDDTVVTAAPAADGGGEADLMQVSRGDTVTTRVTRPAEDSKL